VTIHKQQECAAPLPQMFCWAKAGEEEIIIQSRPQAGSTTQAVVKEPGLGDQTQLVKVAQSSVTWEQESYV